MLRTKNVGKRPDGKTKCPSVVEQTRVVYFKLTLLFNSKTEFALRSTVLLYGPAWIFTVSFATICLIFDHRRLILRTRLFYKVHINLLLKVYKLSISKLRIGDKLSRNFRPEIITVLGILAWIHGDPLFSN